MKANRARLVSFLLCGGGALAAAGCSLLPEAHPDPTRFYVLSTTAADAAPKPDAPVVYLRPVELASYLRARPLIVRRGHNEIEFREFARWGEPLELGVARVLREELLARGAARVMSGAGLRHEPGTEANLTVRVLACEGNTDGSVAFRAVWDLVSTGEKAGVIAGGDYRPADLRWDGKSEASLAASFSQAVSGLAAEIGAALARK